VTRPGAATFYWDLGAFGARKLRCESVPAQGSKLRSCEKEGNIMREFMAGWMTAKNA